MTHTSNYALRLQTSMLDALKALAKKEGTSVNQLINVAVAEKVSALGTEEYFKKRAERANMQEAWNILQKAGKNNPPLPGDELPEGWPKDNHKP